MTSTKVAISTDFVPWFDQVGMDDVGIVEDQIEQTQNEVAV